MSGCHEISREEWEEWNKQLPPKQNTTMTKAQEEVVQARDCDILVSAAAGSGKTWVLVKRILKRVLEERIEVNRFLIVTFTKSAAAEMRERIGKAMEKALEEALQKADSQELIDFLRRQTTLVYQAHICTIDSFCSDIVKQYFMKIDLDPNFRIADDAELAVIRQEVLDTLLNEEYEKEDPAFLHFVECYATGRQDVVLEDIIYAFYQFGMAHPDPENWRKKALFNMKDGRIWLAVILQFAGILLQDISRLQQQAYAFAKENGASLKAQEAIAQDGEYFQSIQKELQEADAGKAYQKVNGWIRAHEKYPVMNTRGMEKEEAATLKELRDAYKNLMKKRVEEQLFSQDYDTLEENRLAVLPDMQEFVRLTDLFSERYIQEKRKQGIFDFADIEHMALQILTQRQEEKFVPGEVAESLREQYAEIMIDEYQDSNYLQEAILTSVSGGNKTGHNMFMVGDMKQSIYRFRLASPELFVGKYHDYEIYDAQKQQMQVKIELDQNFRSSSNVLQSTNYIFYHIMQEQIGNISYTKEVSLKPGACFDGPAICRQVGETWQKEVTDPQYDLTTELLLCDEKSAQESDVQDADAVDSEAKMIAARIQELMDPEKRMLTKDTSIKKIEPLQYRPLRYRDIVILMRSPGSCADRMVKILKDAGIPAYAESRTGYFSSLEVENMLSYLAIIDNSTDDIAVAAVLRGMYQWDARDFAQTEQLAKEEENTQHLLDKVRYLTEKEQENEAMIRLQQRAVAFLAQFDELRKKARICSVGELLQQILTVTGYLDYVRAMPAGERRSANVAMLLEKAREYEKNNFCGAFEFIRYIKRLRKFEIDYGEASLLGENDDVVRVMSIHKSKGLEFPVVFVSNLAKQFNEMDLRAGILLHETYGLGPYLIDPQLRTRQKTVMRNVISLVSRNDMLGEELRILYVALTRAKEKLILTAAVKDMEKQLSGVSPFCNYSAIAGARSYLEWILCALVHHSGMQEVMKQYGMSLPQNDECDYEKADFWVRSFTINEIEENYAGYQVSRAENINQLLEKAQKAEYEDMAQKLSGYLSWQYPYEEITKQRGKYSVSQLKQSQKILHEEQDETQTDIRMLVEEQEETPKKEEHTLPAFLQEKTEKSAAQRGTAVHKFMELYDFAKGDSAKEYDAVVQRMQDRGVKEIKRLVPVKWLQQFFKTTLAQEMIQAAQKDCLYKEAQFVAGFPMAEMQEDILEKTVFGMEEETVLVQGIIDVYYERPDGNLVLLDYKTDLVTDAQELVERYSKQLKYYKKTLEQISGKKVVSCMIYSFRLGQAIPVFV